MTNFDTIEQHAMLVASLAATMSDRDWSNDILKRCQMIREAVDLIERAVQSRRSSER